MKSNTNEAAITTRRVGIIPAALLLSIAASAWSQEAAKPATDPPRQSSETKAETRAPQASESETEPARDPAQAPDAAKPTDASAGAEPANAEGQAQPSADAPKRFIPSQKATADNSATFPIDI